MIYSSIGEKLKDARRKPLLVAPGAVLRSVPPRQLAKKRGFFVNPPVLQGP